MRNNMWVKILLAFLAFIVGTAFFSFYIEMKHIKDEKAYVERICYNASSLALTEFNNLDFGVKKSEVKNTVFDLTNINNRKVYEDYISSITKQAKQAGVYNNSNLKPIFEKITESLNDISAHNSSLFNPMMYGYSFLENRALNKTFGNSVDYIIKYNYNQYVDGKKVNDEVSLAMNGPERMNIVDTNAAIVDGPIFLSYLKPTKNGIVSYQSQFGINEKEKLNMTNNSYGISYKDSVYDYTIAYDVEFTINWKHSTRTPYCRVPTNLRSNFISRGLCDSDGYLYIPMETYKYSTRYILSN